MRNLLDDVGAPRGLVNAFTLKSAPALAVFTVFDTLRYREALGPLVQEEVRTLLDRLAGEVDVDRAVEIIASGAEPLRELIGAVHSKMLRAELRRHGGGWSGCHVYPLISGRS